MSSPALLRTSEIVTVVVLSGQVTALGVSVIAAGGFNATIVIGVDSILQPLASVAVTV